MLKNLDIKRFLKSKITKGGLKITKGGLKITKGGLKITKQKNVIVDSKF